MALLCLLLGGPVSAADEDHQPAPSRPAIEVVGAFFAGGPIVGAAKLGEYLYITTPDRLAIYDISDPIVPTLLGTAVSPRAIYGELISTDGETLLTNDGLTGGTLDVWDVEDKTNPVLATTLRGIPDEHVSCLLECSWAYGSAGTIVDLRDPRDSEVRSENWKKIVGLDRDAIHRIDEYRLGYMATAPRRGPPVVIQVTRPLHPRIVARTEVPRSVPNAFLYSEWVREGRDRFLITSSETQRCDDRHQGALMSFDTKGWPRTQVFEIAGTFKYRGTRESESEERTCQSYYFSLHPDFADGGLILLPNGLEGLRIVKMDRRGQMTQDASFIPPVSDVWLAFWIDDEIFYGLNRTGEVYILRYV